MFLCFGGRSVQQEEMIHEFSTSLWFQVKVRKKKVVFFPFLGFNFSLLPWQDGPGWWHRSLPQSVTYSV